MGNEVPNRGPAPEAAPNGQGMATTPWSRKYGEKHRFRRITDFPLNIVPPRRVRIYQRSGRLLLQWWDPSARKNQALRVSGDLITAIAQARVIEERLDQRQSSGLGQRRLGHRELVERYLEDLNRRADAGEIDPGTATRYASALAHYEAFVEQPAVQAACPHASAVNREFRLAFAAFLNNRRISPNGHPHSESRPMKGQGFVEGVVRSIYEWAADADRGNLLPASFRNPFRRGVRQRQETGTDLAGEPDITLTMAAEFFSACDAYQLALFSPLALFGLRPGELCFLFREYLQNGWLQVPCNADLCYQTKGRRAKRFPLLPCVEGVWPAVLGPDKEGLLFVRRKVVEGRAAPPLQGAPLSRLVEEFRHRCNKVSSLNAAQKIRLRDRLLLDAGGIRYDHVEAEFAQLAGRLKWPPEATAKDFRHLFSTCTENAGVPQHYRQYLLGQSAGRMPINVYTHLNKIREHYEAAVRQELQPLVEAVVRRAVELGLFARKDLST